MRSFPIVMTVTGYCAPLNIRTIRISNKRCQLRIRAKPDFAPRRITVSTSNARMGNCNIISAMWRFSGVNGVCQMQKLVSVFRNFCRPHNSSYAGACEADLVIVAEGRLAPGKHIVRRYRQREGGCHASQDAQTYEPGKGSKSALHLGSDLPVHIICYLLSGKKERND